MNSTYRRQVSQMATDAAGAFDSTLLSNRVHEQVNGAHDRHNDLLELVELSERCYDLDDERDTTDDDPVRTAAFDAANRLSDQIDAARDEQIARACGVIVRDASEWTDVWAESELDAAVAEARTWLVENPNAAERAGVGVPAVGAEQ